MFSALRAFLIDSAHGQIVRMWPSIIHIQFKIYKMKSLLSLIKPDFKLCSRKKKNILFYSADYNFIFLLSGLNCSWHFFISFSSGSLYIFIENSLSFFSCWITNDYQKFCAYNPLNFHDSKKKMFVVWPSRTIVWSIYLDLNKMKFHFDPMCHVQCSAWSLAYNKYFISWKLFLKKILIDKILNEKEK